MAKCIYAGWEPCWLLPGVMVNGAGHGAQLWRLAGGLQLACNPTGLKAAAVSFGPRICRGLIDLSRCRAVALFRCQIYCYWLEVTQVPGGASPARAFLVGQTLLAYSGPKLRPQRRAAR